VVAEQVQSLGAKFLEIDLGDTGQTIRGYAKELTPEQVENAASGTESGDRGFRRRHHHCSGIRPQAAGTGDRDMVEGMQPGSVIVDMAAETGGNVEGSVPNEVVEVNGVTIVGLGNLLQYRAATRRYVCQQYLFNLVEDTWDTEAGHFVLNLENDILPGCVITHDGAIVQRDY
jgi:NAD(P) transhydrogenase subunit alpha